MPRELRRLIFSHSEVLSLLRDAKIAQIESLVGGWIEEIDLGTPTETELCLRILAMQGKPPIRVTLRREQMAALLLRHCMRLNIPMPRIARKDVGLTDGKLTLAVVIDGKSRID